MGHRFLKLLAAAVDSGDPALGLRAQRVVVQLLGQRTRALVGFERGCIIALFLAHQAAQHFQIELGAMDLLPAGL